MGAVNPFQSIRDYFFEKSTGSVAKKKEDKEIPRPKDLKAEAKQTIQELKKREIDVLMPNRSLNVGIKRSQDQRKQLEHLASRVRGLDVHGFSAKDQGKVAKVQRKIDNALDNVLLLKDVRKELQQMKKSDSPARKQAILDHLVIKFKHFSKSETAATMKQELLAIRDELGKATLKMAGYSSLSDKNMANYIDKTKQIKSKTSYDSQLAQLGLDYIIRHTKDEKVRGEAVSQYYQLVGKPSRG